VGLSVQGWQAEASSGLQNTTEISLSVENGNDMKRGSLWPVDDGVIWIPGQRPEAKGTCCEVGACVSSHRRFSNKRAGVEYGPFHAVRGWFAVFRDIGPDFESICFGEGR